MSARELVLLSPYRMPGQNPLMLAAEDVAAFLNGYSALWHPALLHGASAPPRVGSPYDHEQPVRGHVYAVPDTPPLILPDDWEHRVHEAGAISFQATSDRETTIANLRASHAEPASDEAAAAPHPSLHLWNLGNEFVAPFLGIGFGFLVVETLVEAMEHENPLTGQDLWQDVQNAVAALGSPEPRQFRGHLQAAADRLLSAREVVYPVAIHLIDLCLLDGNRPAESLPASLEMGFPLNLVASAGVLERFAGEHPEAWAALRERAKGELLEICDGCYLEREDPLLPLDSQVWNLLRGLRTSKELLHNDVRVFARKRSGAHPQLPTLLQAAGLQRAIFLPFDDAVLPTYRVTTVNWSAPDGKQIEAFTRAPYPADTAQTFFNWAHYVHKTIMQDQSATMALLHTGTAAAPWYTDLLELARFGPVLGQWTTLNRYLGDVLAGEYTSALSADEFQLDYLTERTEAKHERPVSWFAQHWRLRRHLDTAWTLAAMHRGMRGQADVLSLHDRLADLEDRVETGGESAAAEVAEVASAIGAGLAERLLSRAAAENPGFLVLNPCSFARRVALELNGFISLPPLAGPLKAAQLDGELARLVVEVPALGFAWIPSSGPSRSSPPARMRLADRYGVRNEFFEAEIDPETGGLRGIRDHRSRISRLGQQLVFNPGSSMKAREIRVTSAGPALGEIVSEGIIVDEHAETLARFRQRYRAWLGRPVLDLRIEIEPAHHPQGYPWHAYYGARFAWRDERATLLRGVNGTGYVTTHTRPQTPEYLELRSGGQSTLVLPGGLPFHQRHGGRMLDVILIPQGETAQSFDLAIGLDREHPMQTALGLATPVPVVPTTKGPPHVGQAGWLFHLDVTNLVLTSMRPAADGVDAVVARLIECNAHYSHAELRCPRDPQRGTLVDARGEFLLDAMVQGDAAGFEVSPGEIIHLRVEFE